MRLPHRGVQGVAFASIAEDRRAGDRARALSALLDQPAPPLPSSRSAPRSAAAAAAIGGVTRATVCAAFLSIGVPCRVHAPPRDDDFYADADGARVANATAARWRPPRRVTVRSGGVRGHGV